MSGQTIQSAFAASDPLAESDSARLLCLADRRSFARQRKYRKRLAVASPRRLLIPPDRCLVHEQSLVTDFYRVISGALVASWREATGQNQVMGFYFPEDWILPQQAVSDWCLSVRSLTEVKLEVYGLEDVQQASRDDASLGFELFQFACHEFSRRLHHSERLRRLSVEDRLAAFLIECGERLGKPASQGLVLELPMSRTMIAGYLGIRIETISRIIGRWKKAGFIELKSAREIIIWDAAELYAMAAGERATVIVSKE